jgi:uncharacterized LabA/DUF88 family protein
MENILILIDYDNCFDSDEYVAISQIKKIVEKIISDIKLSDKFLLGSVRLYGGWYENSQLTINAQKIKAGLKTLQLTGIVGTGNEQISYSLSIDLATSLLVKPKNDFFATYRKKGNLKKIARISPVAKQCENLTTKISDIKQLLEKGTCIIRGCKNPCNDLIVYKAQQKMVDTMITCDLIQSASTHEYQNICLLSDDDDFIPSLIVADMNHSSQIYRFSPKPSNKLQCNVLPKTIIQKDII